MEGAELGGALSGIAAAPAEFARELALALVDEPPLLARDGGFVAEGYLADLDELRRLRDDSRKVIAQLQGGLIEELAIRALKIKHNNVLGWFIEVPATHADKLTADPARFIHRQTMAGAMRFTTTELADLESRIANAAGRSLALESEVFQRLCADAVTAGAAIKGVADGLAVLDVAAGLAHLAEEENHCRPLVDDSLSFAIDGGRHPVVEAALKREGGGFVANDADLGPGEGTKAAGSG